MTTILKALRELEQQGKGSGPPIAPVPRSGRRWRWSPRLTIVAVGLAVGVTLALYFRSHPERRPVPAQDAIAAVAAVPPVPAAALPPGVAAPAEDAPPWGRVMQSERAPEPTPRPKPREVVAAPPPAAAVVAHPPGGDPHVEVRSIAFRSDPSRCTVTLLVDGRAATLHEGESAGQTEVQLILPDVVYLRRAGSVFAARPGR